MRIWHPEVHYLFNESLYFYLCVVRRPYISEDFIENVKNFLAKERLAGCCYYELFGAFDILFRIWLPAGSEVSFQEKLLKEIDNIHQVYPFRVQSIPKYWVKDMKLQKFDPIALDKLNAEMMRSIQKGDAKIDIINLYKKLDFMEEIEKSENIKAFITITKSNPLPIDRVIEEPLQKLIEDTIEKDSESDILRSSLYMGYGFAWGLVKIEVSPEKFFSIADFVFELSKKLFGFRVSLTTYINTKSNNYEYDDIGEESLESAIGRNFPVAGIVPELYSRSLKVPKELRESIEKWVYSHVDTRKLNEEESDIIHRYLKGLILKDEDHVYEVLNYFFRKLEKFLRTSWPSFVKARVGKKKVPEILDKAGIPEEKRSKFFALGELFAIYSKAIQMEPKDKSEKKMLVGVWNEIAKLRNKTIHGELEPLSDWQEILNLLINYFPKIQLLKEMIEKELVDLQKE